MKCRQPSALPFVLKGLGVFNSMHSKECVSEGATDWSEI